MFGPCDRQSPCTVSLDMELLLVLKALLPLLARMSRTTGLIYWKCLYQLLSSFQELFEVLQSHAFRYMHLVMYLKKVHIMCSYNLYIDSCLYFLKARARCKGQWFKVILKALVRLVCRMPPGFVNVLMGFCVCGWVWVFFFFGSYAILLFLVCAVNLHLSEMSNRSLKPDAF